MDRMPASVGEHYSFFGVVVFTMGICPRGDLPRRSMHISIAPVPDGRFPNRSASTRRRTKTDIRRRVWRWPCTTSRGARERSLRALTGDYSHTM